MHHLEMQFVADSITLTLTLDRLNPKSVGFDIASRTVPTCMSFRSGVFVLLC